LHDTWKSTGQYGKYTLEQQVAIGKYASLYAWQPGGFLPLSDVLVNEVPSDHQKYIYMRSKGVCYLAGAYKDKKMKISLRALWPFIK